MRIFLAIFYCFMNLAGCTDAQNRTMVTTSQENGVVTLDSRTEVDLGSAQFTCNASRSGHCYYAVFDKGSEVRRFALAAAERRTMADLPSGFDLCVMPVDGKVSAGCKAI